MRAGTLDRQLALQTFTLDSSGDPTSGTWSTSSTVWAERMDPRGTERSAGGMVRAAEATQAYRIRYHATITPEWREKDGVEVWNIVATLPEGRDQSTVLLVRRLDPDEVG